MKFSYIFPDVLARVMSKVDIRTQYEASMLSMSLMIIGLILSVTYAVLYLDLRLWFKIVLIINGFFGIVFMQSYIITMFQQYQSYMEAQELQKIMVSPEQEMKGG